MVNTFLLETEKLNDDTVFNKYYSYMSSYRKNKIDKMKFRKDKNLSLGVGIILDYYLQRFNLRELDMNYSTKANGKPFFTNYKQLHFNASHSGKVAICAFSNNETGCDVQQVYKAHTDIAKNFFTAEEYNYIHNNEENMNEALTSDEKFTRIWAAKEAYLKLDGTGLGGLSSFSISIEKNKLKINNSNIYIKEYRFKDYYIAVCSNQSVFSDELKILTF